MLHCKVFLTYKRKRQSSGSVPNETQTLDKSLSDDETSNSLHVGRDSVECPSTKRKNIDKSSKDGSIGNIVPNEPHCLQIGSSSVDAGILGDDGKFHETPSMSKTSKDDLMALGTDSARFRAPLITFIRRSKRRRGVAGEHETVNKHSNKSLGETASENGCNETDSKPEEACYMVDTVCLDEKKIPEADSVSDNVRPVHCDKNLALGGEEQLDKPNVLKNVQEDMDCYEISLNNATKDTLSNNVEEPRPDLNEGVNGMTEGLRPFLDLSVTPTGSSGTPECNVYMESNSQKRSVHAVTETVLGSMDSTSRSHAAIFHQTFPPETSNFRNGFVLEPNCKDIYKAPPIPLDFMSKNKCLQLFAEERTEDSFRSCMVSEGRNIFHFEIENNFQKIKSPPPSLGLSLPTKPKTARRYSKKCFSSFPFLSSIGEARPFEDTATLPQSSSSSFSSILRHKKSIYGLSWTEEELDSLWIGVRRYGRENWDAMVRDPRLRFASWRVAADLAEQWEEEQYKLFQCQNSMPQGVSSGVEETRLSLGDVYNNNYTSNSNNSRRGRNVTRRARFKTAKNNPVRGPYLDYQGVRFEDYGFKFSNCFRDNASVGYPTRGNLPHWLREAVFSVPPAVIPVARACYESQKVGPSRGKDLQTPGEVIVIESDASSEETVSDHR